MTGPPPPTDRPPPTAAPPLDDGIIIFFGGGGMRGDDLGGQKEGKSPFFLGGDRSGSGLTLRGDGGSPWETRYARQARGPPSPLHPHPTSLDPRPNRYLPGRRR
jgi:hypothetical protein